MRSSTKRYCSHPVWRKVACIWCASALPGAAIRDDAAPTDLVLKSIDIAARDIFARHAELEAAGYRFRSKIGRFETDGVVVHEVRLPEPDAVNLVFLEQEGKPEPTSPKGYRSRHNRRDLAR
jgi:hypothetical protein